MIRRLISAEGITRRGLLVGLAAPLLSPKLPVLPLSLAVATVDGRPVVDDVWLARQLHEAKHLMSAHGIFVELVRKRALPAEAADLDTADDRDALAKHVQDQVINVFIVHKLRDVDNRRRYRMGVRWRQRRDITKDYVILASSAMQTTLAHELGHYFGNGHSYVANNIMSYIRNDPTKVAFDDKQGAKMRKVAKRLLRSGKVVARGELE
jgi:hypothetical protein